MPFDVNQKDEQIADLLTTLRIIVHATNEAGDGEGWHENAFGIARDALVKHTAEYHCPCGVQHARGAVDGVDVFRCLVCGKTNRVPKE